MVLIYSNIISARLQYICDFIFKELMHINFLITSDIEEFKKYDGAKINYGLASSSHESFTIGNTGLLFEKGINAQKIDCFEINSCKAFFKTENCDFPFDIFSASFYLLSRYEEYLPHSKDKYGRYSHTNSLAFKENFLQQPLINIWAKELAVAIKNKFSFFVFHFSAFAFLPTYDIDIAYSYKHKGIARNAGGFLKSPSLKRISVLLGFTKDPFDTYKWLDNLHETYSLKTRYFFLVATKNGIYDKNILPVKKAIHTLIKRHAKKYSIGLHPSWQSGDATDLLKKEKHQLEKISGLKITSSRQHYIRFNLPEGYNKLIDAGIKDDYSMGYGTINGFRASVASSFYWYDIKNERQTDLLIHPFCFMDANAFYEQKFTAEQAYEELKHYLKICKQVGGQMITIWHNDFFSPEKKYKGWREMYEEFTDLLID